MPNPRLNYSNEGAGRIEQTFKIDNSTITYDSTKPNGAAATMIGKAVTFSAARTVALCADGDAIVGKLERVESDGTCSVSNGVVTLPGGASATLTLGSAIVGALGASSAKGYIRSAASGTAAELIKCRGVIQDASDTTNVEVNL